MKRWNTTAPENHKISTWPFGILYQILRLEGFVCSENYFIQVHWFHSNGPRKGEYFIFISIAPCHARVDRPSQTVSESKGREADIPNIGSDAYSGIMNVLRKNVNPSHYSELLGCRVGLEMKGTSFQVPTCLLIPSLQGLHSFRPESSRLCRSRCILPTRDWRCWSEF